ncbi:COX15/CtaA family protein [Gracilimonas mengyeensis]|uniref:Cytochrome c oxidase assembly protein subunit 15 n=1 Tax=Gracilimonas mengyeensis TaxID=1302730 RepID=A0A521FNJ8_9BACT|nr:COX15/CtaA family protein [Gracilimonas mengyeensis]SMO97140.1 cytochrome c oxidase assembly protein subunit 15 [Gracilimonas mengyeensis]
MRNSNLRPVYLWLWSGVILVSLMVIIGGITRLTDSGLSMSDWNLIMGSIPPTSEVEWQQAFERYQEFPQYQQINHQMQLDEFKQIYFWEYLHRLLGRMIGIVFLVPFVYFWVKGYFDRKLLKRMFILLGLGAMQGAMGWIMVKSGLVDVPYVSHYRLALHFMLAVILIGFCLWYALDLKKYSLPPDSPTVLNRLKPWFWAITVLFIIQMVYGAFTAGLDAGYLYNSFPKMGGQWLPPTFSMLEPYVANLVENPGTVQWIHRVNGTLLALAVIGFWWKAVFNSNSAWIQAVSGILLSIILAQYLLGVLTLIYKVPVTLGVLHQAVAILFWIVLLLIAHRLYKSNGQVVATW